MEGGTGESFTEKRRVATRVSNRETRIWPGGKLSRLPGAESSVERVRKGAATGAVSAKGVAAGERRTGRAQGSGDEVGPASEHAKPRFPGRNFARTGRAANARARNARNPGARAVQSVTQRSRSSGGFFGKLPPDDGAACPSRSYCRRETLRSHRSLQIIATNQRRRLRCRFHGRTGRADSSPGRLEDH